MLNEVEQGIGYLDQRGNHVDVADFFLEQGLKVTIIKESEVHFKYHLLSHEQPIGRAYFYDNGSELNIVGLHTKYQQTEPKHQGHGKKVLRAIFNFAMAAQRYDEITTSTFAKTGTGFFLSQGFYNRRPQSVEKGSNQRTWRKNDLDVDWGQAQGHFIEDQIKQVRKNFENGLDDDRVLELARSPIGKIVLWHCGNCGYANLKDTKQMNRIRNILGITS